MCDLGGHGDERKHRLALENNGAEIEAFRQRVSGLVPFGADILRFCAGAAQIKEVANRGQQPVVVPRFGDVIGGSGFDEFHRRFQVSPCGEQNDRHVGKAPPDLVEEGDPFLAAGGLTAEIHVLDHDINRAGLQCPQTFGGRGRPDNSRAVQ